MIALYFTPSVGCKTKKETFVVRHKINVISPTQGFALHATAPLSRSMFMTTVSFQRSLTTFTRHSLVRSQALPRSRYWPGSLWALSSWHRLARQRALLDGASQVLRVPATNMAFSCLSFVRLFHVFTLSCVRFTHLTLPPRLILSRFTCSCFKSALVCFRICESFPSVISCSSIHTFVSPSRLTRIRTHRSVVQQVCQFPGTACGVSPRTSAGDGKPQFVCTFYGLSFRDNALLFL